MPRTTDETRIAQQIAQYADVENMHAKLSEINAYWKKAHHRDRMQEGTGVANHIQLYARAIKDGFAASPVRRVVSLGSGDGAIEVQVAKTLERDGVTDYEFLLHELSPIQNERAQLRAQEAGLKGKFVTFETNLNEWQPDGEFAAVIAHHSLHHIVELEHVFDQILAFMAPGGTFATFDIIGRNGHMRWPETYAIINAFWHFLPEDKRRHAVLNFVADDYRDHDSSTQGFEGIRAQDILPELVSRFEFETFFAWGGLTDVFTGRGYGANFDATIPEDQRFISLVDELNEALLSIGAIKPTILCAVMQKSFKGTPRRYRGREPAAMVRDPSELNSLP